MSYGDLFLAKALMDMRVEEAQEEVRSRNLLHLVQARRRGWVARHARRLMGRFGLVLVALGERLKRYGLPSSVPSDRLLGAGV